jgi:hypothetical protein
MVEPVIVDDISLTAKTYSNRRRACREVEEMLFISSLKVMEKRTRNFFLAPASSSFTLGHMTISLDLSSATISPLEKIAQT